MRLIDEIVQEEIIDKMNNVLTINAVGTPVNGEQSVTFCCIKWLKLYASVTVGAYTYPYVSINGNTVLFTIPTGYPPFTVFDEPTIQRPILLNGTLKNTVLEWANLNLNEREKLPFIWLVSPTLEREEPLEAGGGKSYDLKLWFVHWSDWTKKNSTRQAEAIKPLRALTQEFTDTIDRNTSVFKSQDGATQRDFPKFGTLNEQGVEKAMFPSTLSALEYDNSVNLFRRYCEKC